MKLSLFLIISLLLFTQCKHQTIFSDIRITAESRKCVNAGCCSAFTHISLSDTLTGEVFRDTLADMPNIDLYFNRGAQSSINNTVVSSRPPSHKTLCHIPLYNINIINDLLKNHYKLYYNDLTKEDQKRVIDIVLRLETCNAYGKVYTNQSREWKVLKYQCENINNDAIIDSLYINYSAQGKFIKENNVKKYEYSQSCSYSFGQSVDYFSCMANKINFSKMFLTETSYISPNTFYIVVDRGLYTLKCKLVFKYEFVEEQGFVQITKTLLNPTDTGCLSACCR